MVEAEGSVEAPLGAEVPLGAEAPLDAEVPLGVTTLPSAEVEDPPVPGRVLPDEAEAPKRWRLPSRRDFTTKRSLALPMPRPRAPPM